jgi:hypothetical protein
MEPDHVGHHSDQPTFFYVGWVKGTDVFKVGISKNPEERVRTLWYDAQKSVRRAICDALNVTDARFYSLMDQYVYVVRELHQTRKEAADVERAFRHNLPFKRLTSGDWFLLQHEARA